jgi:hypothetical protein
VPFRSPVSVAERAYPATATAAVAGLVVTRYLVTGDPPSDAGAAHAAVACPEPVVTVTDRGTPGAAGARGRTGADGLLAGPVPAAVTAATVNR